MDTATLEAELLTKLKKSTAKAPSVQASPSKAASPQKSPPLSNKKAPNVEAKQIVLDDWSYEDDDLATSKTALTANQLEFAKQLCRLRIWIGSVLDSSPPLSIEQLRNGVILCEVLVKISGNPIANVKTEYPPVMAAVFEYANIEKFLTSAYQHLPELKKIQCEVADLYSTKNLPRFVYFMETLATVSDFRKWPKETGDPTDADLSQAKLVSKTHIDDALLQVSEKQNEAQPEGPVDEWLRSIGMSQYKDEFRNEGYFSLKSISALQESDLQPFITKRGHIRHLLSCTLELSLTLQKHELPAASFPSSYNNSQSDSKQIYDAVRKLASNDNSHSSMDPPTPAFLASMRVATYLSFGLSPLGRAVVADMDGEFCWVGVAGDAAPLARVVRSRDASTMISRIVDCGVLPPKEMKSRPLFLICPLTHAINENAWETWKNNVFLCGPLSAAALTLAAVGRRDGICMEIDVEGNFESIAVCGSRPVSNTRVLGGAQAALDACPEGDLRQKVKRGGVVARSSRAGAEIDKNYVILLSHERWSMASRVAFDPEFQHRWGKNATQFSTTMQDGDLFPLISYEERVSIAKDSLLCAQALQNGYSAVMPIVPMVESPEEMAKRMELLNAMNLARPGFYTLDNNEDKDQPTKNAQIDAVLDMLRPVLPREALHDARDFIVANFWKGRFLRTEGQNLTLDEIVLELPLDVRRQVLLP